MQVKRNLSDDGMKHIAQDLRQGGGDVEPKFMENLLNRGKMLSGYFGLKVIPWRVKEKDSELYVEVTKQAILCNDVKGLVDYVTRKREVREFMNRIGIDGGQGFFKVCLSIVDTSRREIKKGEYKDSGVKKIFVLAIVQDKCEVYENIREIL